MNAIRIIPAIIITAAVVCLESGCTAIGYGIGSSVARDDVRIVAIPGDSALNIIEPGDTISVWLHSGDLLRGVYAGLRTPTADDLRAFAPERAAEDCVGRFAVKAGDELLLERPDREPERIIYLSADPRRLTYTDVGRSTVKPLLFEHIVRLTRCDERVIEKPYADRVEDGTFARTITMLLLSDTGMRSIDTRAVAEVLIVQVPAGKRLLWTVMGLFLDLIVINGLGNARFTLGFGS